MPLEYFLAVAHGIERRGARADGPDAHLTETSNYAADPCEPIQILAEDIRIQRFGMPGSDGVRDAVLRQIIAGRHLAAEAVAPELDRHFRRRIRRSLHQHGDVQLG